VSCVSYGRDERKEHAFRISRSFDLEPIEERLERVISFSLRFLLLLLNLRTVCAISSRLSAATPRFNAAAEHMLLRPRTATSLDSYRARNKKGNKNGIPRHLIWPFSFRVSSMHTWQPVHKREKEEIRGFQFTWQDRLDVRQHLYFAYFFQFYKKIREENL